MNLVETAKLASPVVKTVKFNETVTEFCSFSTLHMWSPLQTACIYLLIVLRFLHILLL